MKLESVLFSLPDFAQRVLINFQGIIIARRRFGSEFKEALSFYHRSDNTKVDQVALRDFLVKANSTEFWNNRFIQFGVDIQSNDLLSEVKKLPVLTKAEVKANIDKIIIKNTPDTLEMKTSGTTGSGLKFPQTRYMELHQWAIWWRYRENLGIKYGEEMAWFGGKTIIDPNRENPPYWRHVKALSQTMFSVFHLRPETVHSYVEEIERKSIKWIHGYPSQVALFSALILQRNLRAPKVKHITLGSENLLESQRKLIETVFQVTPYQHYGLAEGSANMSQDKKGNWKLDQDFCYTEFLSNEGHHDFKIVGTNYRNLAFPLIRYDTGDLVRLDDQGNPIQIDGRKEDFILLPNGTKLGRLDHIFKGLFQVKEAQIVQVSIDLIELLIVKGLGYDQKIEDQILSECQSRFGDRIKVRIEYKEAIERTSSGKLRFVISKLNETNSTRS